MKLRKPKLRDPFVDVGLSQGPVPSSAFVIFIGKKIRKRGRTYSYAKTSRSIPNVTKLFLKKLTEATIAENVKNIC